MARDQTLAVCSARRRFYVPMPGEHPICSGQAQPNNTGGIQRRTMRITELKLEGRGLPERIEFSPPRTSDDATNWITVLNGENGSKKSVLLRLINTAALDRPATGGSAKWPAKISLIWDAPPKQVIAISGTYSDRFPVIAGVPIGRSLTGYDLDTYSYFGPRHASGSAGRARIATQLFLSMVSRPVRDAARAKSVRAVLARLGYCTVVRALVVPNKSVADSGGDVAGDRLKAFISRQIKNVERSDATYARKLTAFLRGLLVQDDLVGVVSKVLQRRDIIVELGDGSDKADGLNELAPYLTTGLLVVDELEFQYIEYQKRPENDRTVGVDELSSGQLQLLNNLLNLALNIQDGTLVLIDEPENSLHPEWQRDYASLLRESMECAQHCHAVVATHSPLVASGVRRDEGSLIGLRRNEENVLVATPSATAHGWLPEAVLEERFDMESARAPELSTAVETALKLLKKRGADRGAVKDACDVLRRLVRELPIDDVIVPAIQAVIEVGDEAVGSQSNSPRDDPGT